MRLFVYGSLMDPALVARLTGRPANPQPATLDGFRRARLRGTPYTTLLRAPGRVHGVLLVVGGRAFRRLSEYESPLYRLTRVRPRPLGSRACVPAHAWIAPA